MTDAVTLAATIEKSGIIFILALIVLWLGYLYMQEKKKTEKLYERILESSKDLIITNQGVQVAVNSFKQTLDSIVPYICASSNPPGTQHRR